MNIAPTTTTLAHWFGADRGVADSIGRALEGCRWVGIPFAGGMSAVAHITARSIVCNDLHKHIINLAKIAADHKSGPVLYRRLRRLAFHPEALEEAQERCLEQQLPEEDAFGWFLKKYADPVDWAADYFVTVWMARGGQAGTDSEFNQKLSFRWNANGGDSNTRFRSATQSLVAWRRILRRCNFTCMDAFEFLAKCEDEDGHGLYCFLPGSTVRMWDESIVPIQSIKPGDVVAPGRTVLRIFARDYSGEAFRIKLSGQPKDPLLLTQDHPVLAIKRRTDIQRDKRSPTDLFSDRKIIRACELGAGDWLLVPTGGPELKGAIAPVNYKSRRGPQPRDIEITDLPSFYRFIGYYAAEGHTGGRSPESHRFTVLSFGFHESDTFAADAAQCVLKSTGLTAVVARRKPHATVTSVRIHSGSFTRTIKALVSGTSTTKQLSAPLMLAPISLQLELLKGWLRGDGGYRCQSRSRARLTGSSASEVLARQMFQISIRCGLRPSFRTRTPRMFDVCFSSEDCGRLGWDSPHKYSRASRRLVKGHVLCPIRSIERFAYSGPVYNLEVDGDHLFCAPYALVHNCDPPWPDDGDSYRHKFGEAQQRKLADRLSSYRKTRVVIRFGVHPLIEQLYPRGPWHWQEQVSRAQSNGTITEALIRNHPIGSDAVVHNLSRAEKRETSS